MRPKPPSGPSLHSGTEAAETGLRLLTVAKELCYKGPPKEGKKMRKTVRLLMVCVLVMLPGISISQERFDGNWLTKLTCPAKGNTEGYTLRFASVIQNSNFRGERGETGKPGYLLIEGKIAADGKAKLSATGIVSSRKYARGVFARQGEDYSYNIKAQFRETEGTGTRDEGLGIVGRPCTFEFAKQQATSQAGGH
jgi:hypothetical protein